MFEIYRYGLIKSIFKKHQLLVDVELLNFQQMQNDKN